MSSMFRRSVPRPAAVAALLLAFAAAPREQREVTGVFPVGICPAASFLAWISSARLTKAAVEITVNN
jgi:hypothetical protein